QTLRHLQPARASPTGLTGRRSDQESFSGVLLGLENLPALVHAGLQIEVMRTAQFAGILVLGIGRLLQGIRRAAHATPGRRRFPSGNSHIGVLLKSRFRKMASSRNGRL